MQADAPITTMFKVNKFVHPTRIIPYMRQYEARALLVDPEMKIDKRIESWIIRLEDFFVQRFLAADRKLALEIDTSGADTEREEQQAKDLFISDLKELKRLVADGLMFCFSDQVRIEKEFAQERSYFMLKQKQDETKLQQVKDQIKGL